MRWPVGGIRTYLIYNYPHLLRQGYRFTFVGPADSSFERLQEELSRWEGVEFVGAPVVKRRCLLRRAVRRLLRSGRYCLIHSQGFTAAAESALASLLFRIPHIVTLHDVLRSDQFRGWTGPFKLWSLGALLGRTDILVSVTTDAQANLLSFIPSLNRKRCRLVTINHGIDLEFLGTQDEVPRPGLRQQLELDRDTLLVGFLGRFMEQKGFLPLLNALKQLVDGGTKRPFHLAAVGSGDFLRQYRAETERLGLTRVVTFLEFARRPGPILAQLDLLVMPSLWEAAGLLAMEAMILGTPVIGSDCIGLREVLSDTPSVTFPTGDVDRLADALRQAIDHPWTGAAEGFRLKARERFGLDRPARELVKLFEECLTPRRTPS